MALTLEDGQNVWRKVAAFLTSHDGGTANPATAGAVSALREYLLTNRGNPTLQFVPFSAADIVTNLGYSPLDVPCKLYALYAKNTGDGDGTDSYITLHNAANNASVPFITGLIQDDNDTFVYIDPNGADFTTDITISAATASGGATESAAANACDGFVIVGAA